MDTGSSSTGIVRRRHGRVSNGDDADDETDLLLEKVDSVDEEDTCNTEEDDSDDGISDQEAPLVEKQDDPADGEGPKSPFMPAGDSLRGVGVILVILYHMGYDQFKNAWFVISLFFSLSGFIMTKNTVEQFERRGQVDVLKFWAKRISRLFPALLLTLIIILLSQKLPFRKNDGLTFQREASDIWYATIFLTNYNLAYNQVDEYFDEIATPSVTRHLWTLSIEEQYYIIWPFVLFLITQTGVWISKNNYNKIGRDKAGENGEDLYTVSGTSKICIRAILMLDIAVMALSYISSTITIKNYGTTQAYYSTMCRMGDIAAGGFMYSFVRLNPSLSIRWFRDPSLPPMSFFFRVILELLALITIILLVTVPMIQTPEDEMLEIYFKWFRLLVSLMISGVVANTIQLSEPLPRWAIVSKIVTFQPLIIVGVISYGVYVFHWPLLVYFGDPKGIWKKRVDRGWEEPYDGVLGYEGRNAIIFVAVMAVGYFSFFYFELPCLTFSRATAPNKTIGIGFLSLAMTLMIHWLITKDLPPMATFENDKEDFNMISIDHRFTPVIIATTYLPIQNYVFSALDYNTRTKKIFKYNLDENTTVQEFWSDEIIQIYSDKEFADHDNFVIIACKNAISRSPCDDPEVWNDNAYWLWLDSNLCGTEDILSNQIDFQERCEDVIFISEFNHVSETKLKSKTDKISRINSMLLGVDDALPGVINQFAISNIESDYDRYMNGGNEQDHSSADEWDPIRITMIGESVGERIAMFWKDIINMDMPNLGNDPFPAIASTNLAQGGRPAIAYFACLSTHPKYQYEQCHQFKNDQLSVVLTSFERSRPNVAVVHDSHHSKHDGQYGEQFEKMGLETFFEKHMAFNIMMNEAKKSGVAHLFFTTMSLVSENVKESYIKEMNVIMQMVDILGCSKGDPSGMWMTVLDWAKLVCPDVKNEGCVQSVHGFETILPDNIHPGGESGLWLTREALGLVLAEVSRYSLPEKFGSYSSWDEAIENPITKHMLKLAPPDGDPSLRDLLSSYYLCPYEDLEALEEDYNQASFPNYKNSTDSMFNSYRDSKHYDVFGAEKDSEYDDLDPASYSNSGENLDWYTVGQKVAQRYDHRVILRGPDQSDPENSAVIDWAVNKTHVRLAVAAPATGYVGFGLADPGGGFKGADMVFLESGNRESLRDTYTTEEGKPQTDDCAGDWELVNPGFRMKKGYMFFETVRLLDTGDDQDQKITNDSNPLTPAHRVLAAWGDSEAIDSIEVNSSRGFIRFFQDDSLEPFDSIMEREAEQSFTVQAVNYHLPETDTNYFATCVTKNDLVARGVPKTDNKLHLVGLEPIIQSKNSAYAHHFLLFAYHNNDCEGKHGVGELIYFWGKGLSSFALPDFLGIPFNGEGEYNSFGIQIHYDNPLKRSDIIDSSGVRFYWTSKVRQEDMGSLWLGDPWVKKNYSPIGKGLSQHEFECPSRCTDSSMDKPITVFQEYHHTHRLGVQTVIDHFRNGEKIRSGKVEYYDWDAVNNPSITQEAYTVEPGDSFTMSCYYNNNDGSKSTFGLGAKEEMCMSFFLYYPRVKKDMWICGYDGPDKECLASYKRNKIRDIKALGRSFPFGDQGEGCPSDL